MPFKVVKKTGSQYFSAAIHGQYRVEYLPGQFVTPVLGKCFLFKTKDAATAFVGSPAGDLEVWECEAQNVIQPTVVLPDSLVCAAQVHGEAMESLRAFWQARYKEGYRISEPFRGVLLRPPVGTLLADSIKLLSKV
jgi:hypothetical protein